MTSLALVYSPQQTDVMSDTSYPNREHVMPRFNGHELLSSEIPFRITLFSLNTLQFDVVRISW